MRKKEKEKFDFFRCVKLSEIGVKPLTFNALHHLCDECVGQSFDIWISNEIATVPIFRQTHGDRHQVDQSLKKQETKKLCNRSTPVVVLDIM